MVRVRIPGGVAPTAQVRGLARVAERYAEDRLHLTTRRNVELHGVRGPSVPDVLDALARIGLSSRSHPGPGPSCGDTLPYVTCSEDAGVGLDEPFDCSPDARAVSDALVERSARLDVTLPRRFDIALGGSPRCRHGALLDDAGLISTVVDGVPGYEVWAGGRLGEEPSLAVLLTPFVERDDVLAAVDALVDVFVAHGDLGEPSEGLRAVVERLGADALQAAWQEAFDEARSRRRDGPAGSRTLPPVDVLPEADRREVLRRIPPGGWSAGVRPQRTPGLASVTIDLALGDTCSSELELCCDLADRHADGHLTFTRDQNMTFRTVPLAGVAVIRAALAERGVHLLGEGDTARIRQHQVGDIGLAGSTMRVQGVVSDRHEVGVVVGRVAARHLDAAVTAIVGSWEALRHAGVSLGQTVRRLGPDAFSLQCEAALDDRWAPVPEPESGHPVALAG